MDLLAESLKETIDRFDGFMTGNLIVNLQTQTVELEHEWAGDTFYIPLSDDEHFIQVRNHKYITVTCKGALQTTQKDEQGNPIHSLYAGVYCRVKPIHEVK
ncbi:hypothetical protein [Salibacterium qingdaonense]|uniref:Uncharacterized protein n=1 Tax=Salibacterium qingdaonense TaxID=266892 RepID=A0A1I4QLT7_9BACI|nr:hypothetical protein [Salibacterium qingdaonense]SFM41038.1 hypothetical protein SAMN04488054_1454 [Salibacterium qingdaonense]